ncbi:hypothetical protein BXZ70DRAFT_900422 [Cristinia sonorae]|uniref:CFA20 domain-containing protein n=1 Tax=Cristinia sonorae TaxID=1940300 RepID=A0A8K0UHE2_9AGAR|nr:hypothetical protein BXZ70DRAFT_900422 [Cristinia sonorae]
MFSTAVQPGLVSLFSSTNEDPLSLFSVASDGTLPTDSFVCLLKDASPDIESPKILVHPHPISSDDEHHNEGYILHQTVLHIQSPTLRTTYIQCGKSANGTGLKHPWIHMQARNMGREWAFEIGIVDRMDREGVVRCSTFQKEPRLKIDVVPPVLLLPLSFPATSAHLLTTWSTITLNLPSLLPHFSSPALSRPAEDDEEQALGDSSDGEGAVGSTSRTRRRSAQVPGGSYSHTSYVKVYANCRLRRIWFTDAGPGSGQDVPWEFQLFGSKIQ